MRTTTFCALLACLLLSLPRADSATARAYGQDVGATVKVITPGDIDGSIDRFTVDIVAEDMNDLGAFHFVLTFDTDVLRANSVAPASLFGAGDQNVVCDEPTIDEGAVRLSCARRPASPGIDGTGTLATVTFEPRGSGKSGLELSRVTLFHSDGTPFEGALQSADVTVTRDPSSAATLVRAAIAIIALATLALAAVALLRMRAARRRGDAVASARSGMSNHP